MKVKITVRTWHSVRDENAPEGHRDKMFLESVYLPFDAVQRIEQWAKEHQIGLLERKYKKQSFEFVDAQRQSWLIASNQLYEQLQLEGLGGESERLAIGFLFTQARDNPELIDLKVAEDYLAGLEKSEAA